NSPTPFGPAAAYRHRHRDPSQRPGVRAIARRHIFEAVSHGTHHAVVCRRVFAEGRPRGRPQAVEEGEAFHSRHIDSTDELELLDLRALAARRHAEAAAPASRST